MNKNKIVQILGFIILSTISIKVNSQDIQKSQNIKYSSFTVSATHDRVLMDWSTDNTVVTNYFEIQKSADGINYKTIALVLGPDPKKQGCDCYGCFEKLSHKNNKAYYRLKHINNDGTAQYSEARLLSKS
jgi:hypothetical protein